MTNYQCPSRGTFIEQTFDPARRIQLFSRPKDLAFHEMIMRQIEPLQVLQCALIVCALVFKS